MLVRQVRLRDELRTQSALLPTTEVYSGEPTLNAATVSKVTDASSWNGFSFSLTSSSPSSFEFRLVTTRILDAPESSESIGGCSSSRTRDDRRLDSGDICASLAVPRLDGRCTRSQEYGEG